MYLLPMFSAAKRTQNSHVMKGKFELKLTSLHTNDAACGIWEDFLTCTKDHPRDVSMESPREVNLGRHTCQHSLWINVRLGACMALSSF